MFGVIFMPQSAIVNSVDVDMLGSRSNPMA